MKALLGFASLAAVLVAVLLLHGAGSSTSNPLAVAIAQAAERCVAIVDANATGLPAGAQPTATLDAKCAIDFGIPKGDNGAKGPTGAQGIAGIPGKNGMSGYELKKKKANCDPCHTSVTSTRSNSFRLSATAPCPPPLKAVGGGASFTLKPHKPSPTKPNTPLPTITASEPTPNGQGWTATVEASQGSPGSTNFGVTLEVTAVCAAVSP